MKVHVGVGDFDPRDARLTPVWERLSRDRVPVVMHIGSGPQPGQVAALVRLGPGDGWLRQVCHGNAAWLLARVRTARP